MFVTMIFAAVVRVLLLAFVINGKTITCQDIIVSLLDGVFGSLDSLLLESITNLEDDNGLKNFNLGMTNPDRDLNITELIKKYGYKVEEHTVTTSDGYILTLIRIPGNGPPVIAMHGILCSADDFVTAGPNKALAYLLANAGYDVWLGNARGTNHSRAHRTLSPDNDRRKFWNFSWHEIGIYDLPAIIDYVLKYTEEPSLYYIGHSQGNTAFFVMCSELPAYNSKIKLMVALSPVAYMTHLVSPVFRLLSPLEPVGNLLTQALGQFEIQLHNKPLTDYLTRVLCGETILANVICSNVVFLICGFNYGQLNVTNAPVVFSHAPSGTSIKQFLHYEQEINSGKFAQYDHGTVENLLKYGRTTPPEYNVGHITAPVALLYGRYNDWLSAFTDVKRLKQELPNVVDFYEIPSALFSHGDFLWGKDVDSLVYKRVLELLQKYP